MISVIVPCYQSEATVAQTLASVAGQSHCLWECVIVNDGSTDRGPDIARKFAQRDPRFRLVDRENGGLSAARNTGIAATSGDSVLFLDADDILFPNALAAFSRALETVPNAGMAVSDFVFVDGNLATIADSSPGNTFSFDSVCMGGPFPVHACCVRRAVLDCTGDFDTSLRACEDWDLWLRAARIGVQSHRVHNALVAYRKTATSMSGDARRMFEGHRAVLERIDKSDDRLQGRCVAHATADPLRAAAIRAESYCTYIGRAIVVGDSNLLTDTVSEVRRQISMAAPRNTVAFQNCLYGMLYETGRWTECKVTGLLGCLHSFLPAVVWTDQQLPSLDLLRQLVSAIVREIDGAKDERETVLRSTSYRIARLLTALKPW